MEALGLLVAIGLGVTLLGIRQLGKVRTGVSPPEEVAPAAVLLMCGGSILSLVVVIPEVEAGRHDSALLLWLGINILVIAWTVVVLISASKEGKKKLSELQLQKDEETKQQTEEQRKNQQAKQEEENRKRAEAETKRRAAEAKKRKEALVWEWLDVMKQWHAQDQKGQQRNPTVTALLERQRERAEKESDSVVKAWLTDRIETLQRQPGWIRPVSPIGHQKEEVNAGEQGTKPAEPVSANPTIDEMWQGTGGPPRPGPNWIRSTWPNEATDFTPWLAKHLELVSACTELDLRFEGAEVYAGGGRADIVARDHKSKSKVVIENQLDAADLDHRKQLALYGEALNAKIRIWIAANFSANIRRDIKNQNRQNELSGGAIYYLLKLRPDRNNPISRWL